MRRKGQAALARATVHAARGSVIVVSFFWCAMRNNGMHNLMHKPRRHAQSHDRRCSNETKRNANDWLEGGRRPSG